MTTGTVLQSLPVHKIKVNVKKLTTETLLQSLPVQKIKVNVKTDYQNSFEKYSDI